MKALSAGAFCMVVLLMCSCGNGTQAGTARSRVQTNVARASSSSPSSAATESVPLPAQELLLHPTHRPPGVNAQFEFVGGAGPGACFEMREPAQVRVLVGTFPQEPSANDFNEKGVATYGQPVDVCFDGMGRGPISVTLDGPQGFTITGVLPALPESENYNGEWPSVDWVPAIEPSWPLGRYVITAHAGSITRSHPLTVVRPRGPGLRVLGPSTDPGHNNVPPNSQATVFMTGFKGGSKVELVAYLTSGFGPHARFFSAAKVPIPPSGNAVVEIPTGPGRSHGEPEPTFIITARSHGKTLFAPFSVAREQAWPGLIVGSLPEA